MSRRVLPRRALLITKTDPSEPRDGGALRVAAITAALREEGWVVDVVPVRTAAAARRDDLAPIGGARGARAALTVAVAAVRVGSATVARWADPRVAAEIARLRSTFHYDLGVVEFSQLLVYRPLLRGLPVLLDMHNLEAELLQNYAGSARSAPRRAVARWEATRLARLESARSLGSLSAVVTVSARETAHIAGRPGSPPVVTAPNGVADAAFEVTKRPARPPVVVFVAHLGWRPNVDAVEWLVHRVWPLVRRVRPDAVLQLVGRSPAASVRALHDRDHVEVHPDVESTLPYLAAASVATAPLLAAGGTRLKILEALATGTPVVATRLGAMGLEHLTGHGLDVEDDPERMAAALLARCADPGDAEAIRRTVDDYRWGVALRPLVGAADSLGPRKDVR